MRYKTSIIVAMIASCASFSDDEENLNAEDGLVILKSETMVDRSDSHSGPFEDSQVSEGVYCVDVDIVGHSESKTSQFVTIKITNITTESVLVKNYYRPISLDKETNSRINEGTVMLPRQRLAPGESSIVDIKPKEGISHEYVNIIVGCIPVTDWNYRIVGFNFVGKSE